MTFPPLADPSNRATRHVPTKEPGSSSLSVVMGGCSDHDLLRSATGPFRQVWRAAPTCEATHQRQTRASDAECPHGRIAPEGTKDPSHAARIASRGRTGLVCARVSDTDWSWYQATSRGVVDRSTRRI